MLGFYLKSRRDVVLWHVFVILRITKECELVSEGLRYRDTQTEATFDLIIPPSLPGMRNLKGKVCSPCFRVPVRDTESTDNICHWKH